MQQEPGRFVHERGDFTTAGIALGATLGAVSGMVFGEAEIGVGAAIGAGAGFVIGALLDAWADRPHGPGRHHGGQVGLT